MSNKPVYTNSSSTGMDAHATGIICYLTWIGFIIAMCIGDREGARFHLNQALVLNLFAFLALIPFVGWIWGIIVFIIGIVCLQGFTLLSFHSARLLSNAAIYDKLTNLPNRYYVSKN